MKPFTYRCTRCEWAGDEPSTTEAKHVDDDGRMTRSVYAVCPECFAYASRLAADRGSAQVAA